MVSTVLVSGANRGVGLALARHYREAGWDDPGLRPGARSLKSGALRLEAGRKPDRTLSGS